MIEAIERGEIWRDPNQRAVLGAAVCSGPGSVGSDDDDDDVIVMSWVYMWVYEPEQTDRAE